MSKARARVFAAVAVVAVGLLAAACGGAAPPGVATLSGSSNSHTTSSGTAGSGSMRDQAIKFSECMRKHGVKNYPNPKDGSTGVQIGSGSGIDPNSPTFKAAQSACQAYLPRPSTAQIHKLEAGALKFSECMRKHGVTDFPDPQFSTSGGGIGIKIGGSKGSLDPSSPTFQAAQKACQKDLALPKGAKIGPGDHTKQAVP
jgi:hypothetical protein